jgi:hypothetical protein
MQLLKKSGNGYLWVPIVLNKCNWVQKCDYLFIVTIFLHLNDSRKILKTYAMNIW